MISDNRMGATRYWLSPPKDWGMRIPDIALKCVVFVGSQKADGDISCEGTGFFVGIPCETMPNARILYLVTAKHVADGLGPEFLLRINKRVGDAGLLHSGDGVEWWYHPTDPFVDVAVLGPISPTPDYEFIWVEEDDFLTTTLAPDRHVGLGDEIFITGLFTELSGLKRNMPVVRIGNIAALPSEKIPIKLGEDGEMDGILIEAHSIAGLSGSPVFVNSALQIELAKGFGPANARFYLLGLMHGAWSIELKNENVKPFEKLVSEMNIGIGVVVPTKSIIEVLYQPGLIAKRKGTEKAMKQARTRPPTPHSAKPNNRQLLKTGVEIPIPTREQFMSDLTKATKRKPHQ